MREEKARIAELDKEIRAMEKQISQQRKEMGGSVTKNSSHCLT
jgi:capsule polysaccharide export protein KpsE/RkpR